MTLVNPYSEHSVPGEGRISKGPEGYLVRFERHLNHPVEKVWRALTDQAQVALWLAPAQIDLRVGGFFQLEFSHAPSVARGEIMELIPLQVLSYTWKETGTGTSLVRWELTPEDGGCRLVLVHSQLPEDAPSFAAGWHTHLDLLKEVLDGVRQDFTWEHDWWQSKVAGYEAQVPQ